MPEKGSSNNHILVFKRYSLTKASFFFWPNYKKDMGVNRIFDKENKSTTLLKFFF